MQRYDELLKDAVVGRKSGSLHDPVGLGEVLATVQGQAIRMADRMLKMKKFFMV